MRRRIVISLGLLLALCVTGDAIALLILNRSIGRITDLAEAHRIQSIRSSLDSSGIRLERDMLSYLVGAAAEDEGLRDSLWRFQDALDQCSTCHHEPRVQSRLAELRATFEIWLEQATALLDHVPDASLDAEQRGFIEVADRVPALTAAMVDQAHVRLEARSDEAKATIHQAWVTLCSTLLAVLVAGGIVAFHLQRSVTGPLYGLLDWVSRSRTGGSEEAPPMGGDEEFRRLGAAFDDAYRDLKRAQDGVVQAEKMAAVGQLAAGVAHEVNNPLASIAAVVHLARARCTSEEDRDRMDLIMEHVNRISGIVRGILSFSRPVRDEGVGAVAVPPLLEHATSLLHFDRRTSNIAIITDCAPDLPSIQASADKLVIVFTNLILNAIDAISENPGGRGTLRISARAKNGSLFLRFADDGPGMSEEDAANAFQPFFTTKQPGAGTGLGLWICYEVVRTHRGRIEIESAPGEGTTITIELPCSSEVAVV